GSNLVLPGILNANGGMAFYESGTLLDQGNLPPPVFTARPTPVPDSGFLTQPDGSVAIALSDAFFRSLFVRVLYDAEGPRTRAGFQSYLALYLPFQQALDLLTVPGIALGGNGPTNTAQAGSQLLSPPTLSDFLWSPSYVASGAQSFCCESGVQ